MGPHSETRVVVRRSPQKTAEHSQTEILILLDSALNGKRVYQQKWQAVAAKAAKQRQQRPDGGERRLSPLLRCLRRHHDADLDEAAAAAAAAGNPSARWFTSAALLTHTPFVFTLPTPQQQHRLNDAFFRTLQASVDAGGLRTFHLLTVPPGARVSALARAMDPAEPVSRADSCAYVREALRCGRDLAMLLNRCAEARDALRGGTPCVLLSDRLPRVAACVRALVVDGVCVAAEVAPTRPYASLFARSVDEKRRKPSSAVSPMDVLAGALERLVSATVAQHYPRRSLELLVLAEVSDSCLPPRGSAGGGWSSRRVASLAPQDLRLLLLNIAPATSAVANFEVLSADDVFAIALHAKTSGSAAAGGASVSTGLGPLLVCCGQESDSLSSSSSSTRGRALSMRDRSIGERGEKWANAASSSFSSRSTEATTSTASSCYSSASSSSPSSSGARRHRPQSRHQHQHPHPQPQQTGRQEPFSNTATIVPPLNLAACRAWVDAGSGTGDASEGGSDDDEWRVHDVSRPKESIVRESAGTAGRVASRAVVSSSSSTLSSSARVSTSDSDGGNSSHHINSGRKPQRQQQRRRPSPIPSSSAESQALRDIYGRSESSVGGLGRGDNSTVRRRQQRQRRAGYGAARSPVSAVSSLASFDMTAAAAGRRHDQARRAARPMMAAAAPPPNNTRPCTAGSGTTNGADGTVTPSDSGLLPSALLRDRQWARRPTRIGPSCAPPPPAAAIAAMSPQPPTSPQEL